MSSRSSLSASLAPSSSAGPDLRFKEPSLTRSPPQTSHSATDMGTSHSHSIRRRRNRRWKGSDEDEDGDGNDDKEGIMDEIEQDDLITELITTQTKSDRNFRMMNDAVIGMSLCGYLFNLGSALSRPSQMHTFSQIFNILALFLLSSLHFPLFSNDLVGFIIEAGSSVSASPLGLQSSSIRSQMQTWSSYRRETSLSSSSFDKKQTHLLPAWLLFVLSISFLTFLLALFTDPPPLPFRNGVSWKTWNDGEAAFWALEWLRTFVIAMMVLVQIQEEDDGKRKLDKLKALRYNMKGA